VAARFLENLCTHGVSEETNRSETVTPKFNKTVVTLICQMCNVCKDNYGMQIKKKKNTHTQKKNEKLELYINA